MTEQYTTSTRDVRGAYIEHQIECGAAGYASLNLDVPSEAESRGDFDRWISEHDAKVRADALREFADRYQDEADWRTPADIDPDLIREVADRIEKEAGA